MSTRNRTDTYTAHRALHESVAPNGGMFVPFQLPHFDKEEILLLKKRSFCENVANILSTLFPVRMTGWDVELCIGRYPAELVALPRKLVVAELWHNLSASYSRMERAIYARLSGDTPGKPVPEWVRIAIQTAFLFAVYGISDEADCGDSIDIAVESSGFSAPMAAWFAREMGLPIGVIICASYECSDVWDLLCMGELNTGSMREDSVALERLIFVRLGAEESKRFVSTCAEGKTFTLDEQQLPVLSDGFFAAVVSKERSHTVLNSFYRSNQYIADSFSAVSFAALQDYRSKTGESRNTLLLSLECPVNQSTGLSQILGVTAEEIEETVHHRKG